MKEHFLKPAIIRMAALAVLIPACALTVLAADEGGVPPPKDEPQIIEPGPPPSDAVVLFNGKDLAQWSSKKGGEPQWVVAEGVVTVNGTGDIITRQLFGDCQLHVEWATPA